MGTSNTAVGICKASDFVAQVLIWVLLLWIAVYVVVFMKGLFGAYDKRSVSAYRGTERTRQTIESASRLSQSKKAESARIAEEKLPEEFARHRYESKARLQLQVPDYSETVRGIRKPEPIRKEVFEDFGKKITEVTEVTQKIEKKVGEENFGTKVGEDIRKSRTRK